MSVTIRLARIGRKNLPAFKLVVANTRSKRNGYVLDTIGSYNPSNTPVLFTYDKDKFSEWTKKGALVTEAVTELIKGNYEFKLYPSAKKLKREAARAAQKAEKGE